MRFSRASAFVDAGGNRPPQPASARRRLMRDGRHALIPTHANICTIYDVGDVDGRPYIVMEYVDGRSLRAVLHAAVPDLASALDIGIQVADALAHAHDHDIVHR